MDPMEIIINPPPVIEVQLEFAKGAKGDPGQGFVWRGAWSDGQSYVPYDLVLWNGSVYLCIQGIVGDNPSNTMYWDLFASKGDNGNDGAAGPNTVSTSTATGITGILKGNGATVSGLTPGTGVETWIVTPNNTNAAALGLVHTGGGQTIGGTVRATRYTAGMAATGSSHVCQLVALDNTNNSGIQVFANNLSQNVQLGWGSLAFTGSSSISTPSAMVALGTTVDSRANSGFRSRNFADSAFAGIEAAAVGIFSGATQSIVFQTGVLRAANGMGFTLGSGFANSSDNILSLRMRQAGIITFGTNVGIGSSVIDQAEINNGTLGTLRDLSLKNVIASGLIISGPFTVASLPVAASSARATTWVTNSSVDRTAANIGAVVAGGGAFPVPVICNGTDWRIL
jgi:hypothetical protein